MGRSLLGSELFVFYTPKENGRNTVFSHSCIWGGRLRCWRLVFFDFFRRFRFPVFALVYRYRASRYPLAISIFVANIIEAGARSFQLSAHLLPPFACCCQGAEATAALYGYVLGKAFPRLLLAPQRKEMRDWRTSAKNPQT